jgi:ABC-type lipopolysaccharide export system ATPase subunit
MTEKIYNRLFAKDLNQLYGLQEIIKNISIEVNNKGIVRLLSPNGDEKTMIFTGFSYCNLDQIFLNQENIRKLYNIQTFLKWYVISSSGKF